MSRKANFVTLAALLCVLLCVASAGATVIYSTLSPNGEYDTTNGYFVDGANYFNEVIAMPFTPSQTLQLLDAVLALGNYAGGNNPINLYLESDNGGLPGNILATLTQVGTIPSFNSGGGLITFNCSSCPVVSMGTQYWIVAVEPDPNTEQVWMYAYNDQFGPSAFNNSGSPNGPWNQYYGTWSGFRIDGTPEPGTLVMFGSGVLAAAAGFRRKIGI